MMMHSSPSPPPPPWRAGSARATPDAEVPAQQDAPLLLSFSPLAAYYQLNMEAVMLTACPRQLLILHQLNWSAMIAHSHSIQKYSSHPGCAGSTKWSKTVSPGKRSSKVRITSSSGGSGTCVPKAILGHPCSKCLSRRFGTWVFHMV